MVNLPARLQALQTGSGAIQVTVRSRLEAVSKPREAPRLLELVKADV
jgi:hypothetical protein